MTLYLLGLRASGKSTVGPAVAELLRTGFVDLDQITPTVLGVATAAEALRIHGLPAFRDAERSALDDPRVLAAGIVALGGGTPTHPPSRRCLNERKTRGDVLIYLRATVETLRARLAATDIATRPSLTGAAPIDEVETLWNQRDPLYQRLADVVIDVDRMTTDEVVRRVLESVR